MVEPNGVIDMVAFFSLGQAVRFTMVDTNC